MKSKLISILLGFASLASAKADDFFIGTRGPKDWQLDERITYSEKHDKKARTDILAHTAVVKHWTGDKLGWFGIGILPYKHIEKSGIENTGFGDLTIKTGPRGYHDFGSYGSFHWIINGGFSFPTGNEKKPALGTGGYDAKLGFTTTYLTKDKKNELTTSFEYTFPEQNAALEKANDISAGFIAGRQVNKKLRLGLGMTGNLKQNNLEDGNYSMNARVLARYNLSKSWHLQFLGETSMAERNMPHGFTVGTFLRYNF